MTGRKIAFFLLFLLPVLPMAFNSCSQASGPNPNSQQKTDESNLTIAGNPMSEKVKYAICSVLIRCNSGVTIEDCDYGVNQSLGIGTKLGLLSGTYDLFAKFKAAESGKEIVSNPIALNPCYGDINTLMCNNPMVLSAYDSASSTPFAKVANMIPTAGSCINTAWTPGVWQWAPITNAAGLSFIGYKQAYYPYPAILNSKLYFSWVEQDDSGPNGGAYNVRVASYNGNDLNPAFKIVDGSTVSGLNYDGVQRTISTPNLVTYNGKLYAFWDEGKGAINQIRGKVFNGNDLAPVWTPIDAGGVNRSLTSDARLPHAGVFNGKLYVSWTESNGSAAQIRVAVYNGNDSSPAWALVDGGGSNGLNFNPSKDAEAPTFVVYNSKLYVTWLEWVTTVYSRIHMAVYNGNDGAPAWQKISGVNGLNREPADKARNPRGVVFNNKLYLSWQEWFTGDEEEVRVAVYNGNDSAPALNFVDGGANPNVNWGRHHKSQAPQLIVFNSQLINIWREGYQDNIGHVRAKMYNANDASPMWSSIDGNSPLGLNFDPTHDVYYGWNHNPMPIVFNSKIYTIWEEDTHIYIKVGVPPP